MTQPSATIVNLSPKGPHPLPAGTQLNGVYEIESLIASGGTADVYRARTIETNDKIAIKIIKPEIARDKTLIGLLRKEATTLSKISHEAVVRYFLFSIDPKLGSPYLAMELVEGPSLADLLKSGPLSVASVKLLHERIGSGLDAVHRLGVTHRDVSPDNIIVPRSDPGLAKLIDFGIARSAFGDGTIIAERFAGKFAYASPEHMGLHQGVVSPKSDIYSFGLTLAAALRGSPIDMGSTQVGMLKCRQTTPDLRSLDPKIRNTIAHMLRPDPDDRPETLTEPIVEPSRTGPPPQGRPPRRSWLAAGGAALAICVVAGGLGWRLGRGEDRPEQAKPEPVAPTVQEERRERQDARAQDRTSPDAAVPAKPPSPDAAQDRPVPVPLDPGPRSEPAPTATPSAPLPNRDPAPEPPAQQPPRPATPDTARPEPARTAEPAVSDPPGILRDCAQCPPMVAVPAGSFQMGSGADPSEKPVHTVRIRAFAIGRSPITVAEWQICVEAGDCEAKVDGKPDQPAANLSWDDAQQYVRWLSKTARMPYRLPSEAEWEYAARGGTQTRFWWGDRFQSGMAACRHGSAPNATVPPFAWLYPSNAFGIAGTTCLVSQWVSDCWHKNFVRAPADGSPWTSGKCPQRVLRGGSWLSNAETERITTRDFYDAAVRYPTNGFRIARDL